MKTKAPLMPAAGITPENQEIANGEAAILMEEGFIAAATEAQTESEKAAVMAGLGDTPRLSESGIAPDVLALLLPDAETVFLPRVSHVAGGMGYRFVKRAFDLLSCGAALALLVIPMTIIACKIKTESPGPAIYAQKRVGKDGRIFELYKFRSMYLDAEARGAQWAKEGDPRVTPFGRFMRKTRLAPVIIGTPGDGEPTKSLSHPVNSSLDLHKCERRPEPFLVAQTHYTSIQFLSFVVFGGLGAAWGRRRCACGAASLRGLWAVA